MEPYTNPEQSSCLSLPAALPPDPLPGRRRAGWRIEPVRLDGVDQLRVPCYRLWARISFQALGAVLAGVRSRFQRER